MILALTLGDETTGTVDTSRVELHELEVLQREASPRNHRVAITRARVCTRAREVRATVPTGREHGLVCTEAVERTVLHVERHDTDTLAVLHDEIKSEVLDEEVGVVAERLAVECVEKRVTGTVRGGSAAVRLAALAELERLATECTLVDLALLCS